MSPSIVLLPERREFVIGQGDCRVTGSIDRTAAGDSLLEELSEQLNDVNGILCARLDAPSPEMESLIRRVQENSSDKSEQLGIAITKGRTVRG